MPVEEIKTYEQFKEITTGDIPVVIDFWAPWCGPCRAISPILDKFADLAANDPDINVKFYKVDIDALDKVAEECAIAVIPTFLAFKDGVKSDELRGANPTALKEWVSRFAGKSLKV